jgi:predicted nucleic acid-binding protein
MNVVDSSLWLDYLAGRLRNERCARMIESHSDALVPSVCLLEVYKVMRAHWGEDEALKAVVMMRQGRVVDMDAEIAVTAAKLGMEHKLPLADSVIYTTASMNQATLWTRDAHFKGLEGVEYLGD